MLQLQRTQRGMEIETMSCLGRSALTLTPVDRTTATEDGEDGEAGEETTSASAQASSGCSTHTAVPGRKIIAAAAGVGVAAVALRFMGESRRLE